MIRPWRLGVNATLYPCAAGLYDIYFVPQEAPLPAWGSDYPHVVYWNGFLISDMLNGYNATLNFISDFEKNCVPHIVFNEEQ